MTVPSILLALIVGSASLGCIGVGVLWRSKVALQLRLDRCVEKTALELVSIQSKIEASNTRMRIERAAAVLAAIPTAGASIRAAEGVLTAEMTMQEILRGKWRLRQASWLLGRGCDARSDLMLPLPSLAWWRPPADFLGPQPLEWKGAKETGLTIRLWRSNRRSTAKIRPSSLSASSGGGDWGAAWAPR